MIEPQNPFASVVLPPDPRFLLWAVIFNQTLAFAAFYLGTRVSLHALALTGGTFLGTFLAGQLIDLVLRAQPQLVRNGFGQLVGSALLFAAFVASCGWVKGTILAFGQSVACMAMHAVVKRVLGVKAPEPSPPPPPTEPPSEG